VDRRAEQLDLGEAQLAREIHQRLARAKERLDREVGTRRNVDREDAAAQQGTAQLQEGDRRLAALRRHLHDEQLTAPERGEPIAGDAHPLEHLQRTLGQGRRRADGRRCALQHRADALIAGAGLQPGQHFAPLGGRSATQMRDDAGPGLQVACRRDRQRSRRRRSLGTGARDARARHLTAIVRAPDRPGNRQATLDISPRSAGTSARARRRGARREGGLIARGAATGSWSRA
jgi:hypothetical protein